MKKIVIQCAGSKNKCGSFIDQEGRLVKFVAQPELCEQSNHINFQNPDSLSQDGTSWREKLIDYNNNQYEGNPLKFLTAFQLYKPQAYQKLVDGYGVENIYILSAGWGLVNASYLLPDYDITFSGSAEKFKRRKKSDTYNDFRFLNAGEKDEIIFLGGKDYQNLFIELTNHLKSNRTIVYNASERPECRGVNYKRFNVKQKTNWHYTCVEAIENGEFEI